jgi:hypothetical protein
MVLDYRYWLKNHLFRDPLILPRILYFDNFRWFTLVFLPLPPPTVALDLWEATTL